MIPGLDISRSEPIPLVQALRGDVAALSHHGNLGDPLGLEPAQGLGEQPAPESPSLCRWGDSEERDLSLALRLHEARAIADRTTLPFRDEDNVRVPHTAFLNPDFIQSPAA